MSGRSLRALVPTILCLALLAVPVLVAGGPAAATPIERVTSPGGLEAWLVREPSVPLIALSFAFAGGANDDPADRPGVAGMVTDLLDEGAGDLDSKVFHERLEANAIEMSFSAERDHVYGTLRTLGDNRDLAFDLLRLALNAPRFDSEAVERVRAQTLTSLRRATSSPGEIASLRWWQAAFPGHPYGQPTRGSLDSVPQITTDDLRAYVRRVFARSTLKIALVGDIDAATAGTLIDRVFGTLPAAPELQSVPAAAPQGLGRRIVVDLDVPQAVIAFGGTGIARKDPDFIAGFILNHILGGGSMSSRLYQEVREKRGLAYGIRTGLVSLTHAALVSGNTATRDDRAAETLQIIDSEIARFVEAGPTAEELAKAKSYVKGAYALNFDTSSKIAGQLVQIQLDDLGIDYVERRQALIDAITLEDAQRVAKRLFAGGLLVTVVGRPQGVAAKDPGG